MIQFGKSILIVDDEPLTREGVRKALEAWSAGRHQILCADNGTEAIEMWNNRHIHLIITDIRMPEVSGLQVAETIRGKGHKPAIIFISGYPDFQYAQAAIQLGVVNYLLKPIHKRKLLEAVEQALGVEEERERIEAMEKMVDPLLLHAKTDARHCSPPVLQALRYVEEHLQAQLGMREVANRIHLNPSYFSALFKEQMGFTFSEYVTRNRLQRAKELLLQTRLPVSDISEQVGYRTPKYFIQLFKEYEGKSPSRYRKDKSEDETVT